MIETLANLRSGKSKTKSDQGPDATQRMKRFLNGLGKKRRREFDPAKILVCVAHAHSHDIRASSGIALRPAKRR